MAKKDTNKELHNQLVYTRQLLDEMTSKYYIAKEEAEANFKAMDAAYKEQEEMLIEVERNLNLIHYHCHRVKFATGKITQEDVHYYTNLVLRTINNKYRPNLENDGRDS